MSNLEKAVEIIAEARRTAPRVRDMQDHVSPHIAQALADAGLLAPDLPTPTMTPESHPGWAQWHREEWDSEPPEAVWQTPGKDEWWISYSKEYGLYGGWTEFPEEALEGLNPEDMKAIAGVFLAAANYAEEKNQ
ncbi:hypothetical protein [Corynebacterium flavescens]|uniref:Uncharacterized protein n=1 Tax=Corynebacterium flavescens TaxID=28028 RepID=A0A1L7CNJ4_CORFL|nr:hypothetical protein [Corynebacterium flavescens]APT87410.1 hypothetical protein CFLV_09635 [Corynebacterium flavescens]KAA8720498.1 hypothetical protein F4V60_09370 [Corynebacterium flavescens]GEB97736.1 hypothetical protein CFL01nite_12310 [Corynebacterium flavescens]